MFKSISTPLQVWTVLTDYKRLTEYVPNLDVCERLRGGTKSRYRLRQAGCSQSLFLRLEASAELDVQEVEGTMGRRELRFSMIKSESFKVSLPSIISCKGLTTIESSCSAAKVGGARRQSCASAY